MKSRKILSLLVTITLVVFTLGLNLSLSHEKVKRADSNTPIKVAVIEFDDASYSGAGSKIASFINLVLSRNPKLRVSYISLGDLYNDPDNLGVNRIDRRALADFGMRKGYHIVISGMVVDSGVKHSNASVPVPGWDAGVNVSSVSAYVAFEVVVVPAGNPGGGYNARYRGEESAADVGGWAWTDWGYVDVSSDSFQQSPMGKALQKAVEKFRKDFERNLSKLREASRLSITSTEAMNSISSPSEQFEWLKDVSFQKVYQNDFADASIGSAIVEGIEPIILSERPNVVKCDSQSGKCLKFKYSGKEGAIFQSEKLSDLKLKLILDSRGGSGKYTARIFVGDFKRNDGDNIPEFRGLILEINTTNSTVNIYFSTGDIEPKPENIVAKYDNLGLSAISGELQVILIMLRDRLGLTLNGNKVVDIKVPKPVLSHLPKLKMVGLSNEKPLDYTNMLLKRVEIYVPKLQKVDNIISKLKLLGVKVNEGEDGYLVKLGNALLFTERDNKLHLSEDGKEILKLVDELARALKARKVSYKCLYREPQLSSLLLETELLRLSSGNYEVVQDDGLELASEDYTVMLITN